MGGQARSRVDDVSRDMHNQVAAGDERLEFTPGTGMGKQMCFSARNTHESRPLSTNDINNSRSARCLSLVFVGLLPTAAYVLLKRQALTIEFDRAFASRTSDGHMWTAIRIPRVFASVKVDLREKRVDIDQSLHIPAICSRKQNNDIVHINATRVVECRLHLSHRTVQTFLRMTTSATCRLM